MAVRRVEIRITADDSDAKAKLDAASAKSDELGAKRVTVNLAADDTKATEAIGRLKIKLADLGAESTDLRLNLDDADALLSLDRVQLRLDALSKKTASPKVTVDGVSRAIAETLTLNAALDRLDGKRVAADVGSGGLLSKIGGIFGLGGGGGGGGGVIAGAGGMASGSGGAGSSVLAAMAGANNPVMGGLIAGIVTLIASMAPAVIPAAIGGLVGGGAAFGSLKIGSNANQQIQYLQQTMSGITGKTPASVQRRAQLQGQINAIQQKDGTFLGAYRSFSNLGHSAASVFSSALNSSTPGERGTVGRAPNLPGESGGPGSHLPNLPGEKGRPGGLPGIPGEQSFTSGLTGIMGQVGGFVKQQGPDLGAMFRASLPILQMFVHSMETLAKLLMPAFTSAMKALAPSLPTIEQGFKALATGIANFIILLGPGMKDAAVIFKAVMTATGGLLEGLAVIADTLAGIFRTLGHVIMEIGHGIKVAWTDGANFMKSLPGKITGFLKDLPGSLFNIGKSIITGLINGVKAMFGSLGSFLGGIGSFIANHKGPIDKDALLLVPHGKAIMGGLMVGIASRLPDLGAQLGHITSSVSGIGGGASYGRSAGGPMMLRVTANGDDLTRAIVQALRYEIRENGAGNVQRHLGWGAR